MALGLWPVDGWSGNTAPKVSGDPSSACLLWSQLGLESDAIRITKSWMVKGCALPAGHHSVVAGDGGNLHHLPSSVSLSLAQIQPDSWVPSGGCTHVLGPHSLQAGQSPAASSSHLVGADLPCPPPACPARPHGGRATSPSPGLPSCHLRSDVQAQKPSLSPAGLASPHWWWWWWWGAAPCKHHPNGGVGAQFPAPVSSAGAAEHPQTVPRS